MPELSPQAQEVFWAFNRAASGKPDDWHYLPAIAAALRAAADQWKTEIQEQPTSEFIAGIRNSIDALNEIAAELKAQ